MKKPLILCVLDGWGYSENAEYNAILSAKTPNWDYLWNNFPHGLLSCSGRDVGLPHNLAGNSEVGHLHLGSGEVILQDLEFINQQLPNISDNSVFKSIYRQVKSGKNIHLIGLCSDGGVHSHIDQIIRLYKELDINSLGKVFLHFISDGRDTFPFLAEEMLDILLKNEVCNISTLIGRQYSMDRNENWNKTNLAFSTISGKSEDFSKYSSFQELKSLIRLQYQNGLTDELLTSMVNANYNGINSDDLVLFCNFRIDRMVQLASVFVQNNFNCYSLTDYGIKNIEGIFPKRIVNNTLGKWISGNNLNQLRLAESEKFPHVTYFFNGNTQEEFANEHRICIRSKIIEGNSRYNDHPEMSANEVMNTLISEHGKYDFVLVNFANLDMVGHTGDFQATIRAVEEVDKCLERFINLDCSIIITADHGNAELMYDKFIDQPHTKHTNNPVPIIFVNLDQEIIKNHFGSLMNNGNHVPSLLGNLSIVKKVAIDALSKKNSY